MMSMTGFGQASLEVGGRSLRVEVRTVNNRFLDVKVRLPWPDGEAERRIVDGVRRVLSRGRVEVAVWQDDDRSQPRADAATDELRLNVPFAQRLCRLLDELTGALRCDRATAVQLLPPMRELIGAPTQRASAELLEALESALVQALDDLLSMRRREGQALCTDLRNHLRQVGALIGQVAELADRQPALRQARLAARLERLLKDAALEADAGRLAQELALLADRCDVSEELARLRVHEQQLVEMLGQPAEVGRKIEFMLQELNRELNTIASKIGSAEIVTLVVEAKGCLEKMREQAQNAE